MFSCTSDGCFTDQIQLRENGIIETHIQSKTVCLTWNGGQAIHGVQNSTGTIADIVPGRNFPNVPPWSTQNEGTRFTYNGTNYNISSVPFRPIVSDTTVGYFRWYVIGSPIVTQPPGYGWTPKFTP